MSYRIRLSHKYDIKDLLQTSVRQLKVLYPSVVFRWTEVQKAHPYSTRAITAVNLARLTETLSVLPSALYVCCQLPETCLFDGAKHADGTSDILDRDDLQRCVRAKTEFAQMRMDYVHTTFDPSNIDDGCLSKTVCKAALRRIQADAISLAGTRGDEAGIFEPLDEVLNQYERDGDAAFANPTLCERCMKGVDTANMVNLFFTWAELPEHFHVAVDPKQWARPDGDESEPEFHRRLREEGERVSWPTYLALESR